MSSPLERNDAWSYHVNRKMVQWINPCNYDLGFNIENRRPDCLDMQDCYSLIANQISSTAQL